MAGPCRVQEIPTSPHAVRVAFSASIFCCLEGSWAVFGLNMPSQSPKPQHIQAREQSQGPGGSAQDALAAQGQGARRSAPALRLTRSSQGQKKHFSPCKNRVTHGAGLGAGLRLTRSKPAPACRSSADRLTGRANTTTHASRLPQTSAGLSSELCGVPGLARTSRPAPHCEGLWPVDSSP